MRVIGGIGDEARNKKSRLGLVFRKMLRCSRDPAIARVENPESIEGQVSRFRV